MKKQLLLLQLWTDMDEERQSGKGSIKGSFYRE